MCDHLYQVFVKYILLQSSLVVFLCDAPPFLCLKEGDFFVEIYFEFKEMIELKKAGLNKQKSPETKAFSYLFLCPLHEFVRTFHIENKQKC